MLATLNRAAKRALPSSARLLSAAASSGAKPEELERKYLLGNYSADGVRVQEGLVFVKGQGSKLFDSTGKEYLDFCAGIAVNALGHSDPGVAAVIEKQAHSIQHLSNIFHSWEPLELAQLMVQNSKHFSKVFFCNSGTEANEAALKFARKFALNAALKKAAGIPAESNARPPAFTGFGCKGNPPTRCMTQGGMCGCWPQAANNDLAAEGVKNEVIAFKNSFHGRTMGSLAVTHKPAIRWPFGPFPADVRFARFNNIDDVHKQWTSKVGAVIVEPVQGEGGIYPADPAFMKQLRALCTERGALLIVDEVQCGLGRTGRLWAHEAYEGVAPDIMTLAKPLAGGLPIGAVMMTDAVAASIAPGDHGTTYGGNPFVTAVASHVFARIAQPEFLASVRARGAQLLAGCRGFAAKYPHAVKEVRGTVDGGLFVGMELAPSAPFKALQMAAVKRGLLVISCGDNTVRLCPPLNISEGEVAHGLRLLDAALAEAYPAPAK